MTTIGQITSTPDANGNHKLKCPKCHTVFFEPIIKDDITGILQTVICDNCHHADEPLAFIHAANKARADAMAMNYAEHEMKNMLKKAFRGSKYIKIK